VTTVDGPALRALRNRLDVPLRRIARVAGMSHGHLSKVERGEYGRPVTPAIINAYRRVLGVDVAEVIAGSAPAPAASKKWRPGDMSPHQRRAYASQVAAVAVGSPPGKPSMRLLQHAGPVPIPSQLIPEQLASIMQITHLLGGLDGLAGHLAHALLAWVLHLPTDRDTEPPVLATIAALARRAARSAVSLSRHEPARTLYLMALDAATGSGDPDLRATVLADIAEHYLACTYREECIIVLRLAEGDERLSEDVRSTLKVIRSRAERPSQIADSSRDDQENADPLPG
jgi:transcriptional regulator with XRE-family HTH domain